MNHKPHNNPLITENITNTLGSALHADPLFCLWLDIANLLDSVILFRFRRKMMSLLFVGTVSTLVLLLSLFQDLPFTI